MEFGVTACIEVTKCAGVPMAHRIKYLRELEENITILTEKRDALEARESDVKKKLQMEEEIRSRKPLEEVKLWLEQVDKVKTQVSDIERSFEEHKDGLSHLFTRIKLAKRVVKQIGKVDELLGNQFQNGEVVVDATPADAMLFEEPSFPGQSTVEKKINEIMELLMNPEISKIGVHGMGGIGKTSIMKKVNDKVATTVQFDRIIWVTVSKDMGGIEILQSRIAMQFGDDFGRELLKCEDKEGRASMLLRRMKRVKKLVLILDDVWQEISLKKVGIPEPTPDNQLKIVLTTRLLKVCDFLETQVNVEVKCLSDEEAWNLFKSKIDKQILNPEIECVARELVRECGGLPLAIITIGPVMRRMRNIEQWKHSLKELKSSKAKIKGPEGDVFQLLRFKGYTKDEESERFEYVTCSREMEYGKGLKILQELQDSCLLEAVQHYEEEYIRMHDLVRDLAIRIMGEEFCFLSKAGLELTEFPTEAWEKVSKVSLMRNNIGVLPEQQLNCSNLSTLLLPSNPFPPYSISLQNAIDLQYPPINFPEPFFSEMPILRVLDLSYCHIIALPSSISDLTNLRALFLQSSNLKKIPSLEKLKQLEFLNLGSTEIEELKGLEALVSLKYLDLTNTTKLNYILPDAISKLTLLEDLHVRGCKFFIGNSLMAATNVHVHLKHIVNVEIGEEMEPNMFRSLERLKLDCMHDLKVIWKGVFPSGCFANIKFLFVETCTSLKYLFSHSVLQQLKNIEAIRAYNCREMEEILSAADDDCQSSEGIAPAEIVLPKLHSLYLRSLPMLHNLSKRTWLCESLKAVAIFGCPKLIKLPFERLPALENIYGTKEWWEALEWDNLITKCSIQPRLTVGRSDHNTVFQLGNF
ncbi:hypothetical protein Sjap_025505 [Stephania japonica]|uniref:NB-ARC domain-containing protein n=1 Tax=Stephania japonica TaxID=461633 RepID=A0AAP0HFQ3_9MAGN